MEVKTLNAFCGAWAQKGQDQYLRLGIKAEYDLGKVSSRTRKPVIIGLRTGVLSTTGGQAACVFRVLCQAFDLKYVCASRAGGHMYTNFNDDTFYEACLALYGLTSSHGHDPVMYINRNHNGGGEITCWSWRAKDEATRNIFHEAIGLADIEVREKAIDFLCSGGKLEQTWIDKNPI